MMLDRGSSTYFPFEGSGYCYFLEGSLLLDAILSSELESWLFALLLDASGFDAFSVLSILSTFSGFSVFSPF